MVFASQQSRGGVCLWVDEAGISNDGAKWAATDRVTADISSLLLLLKTAEEATV